MTSLRKLRRRHDRWRRYVARTMPRGARPLTYAYPPGWSRTESAVWDLVAQRRPPVLRCIDCGLPDAYHGQGDGIGSCDCPRCAWCWAPPGDCDCQSWGEEYEDDDEPVPYVVTEHALEEAGLL